MKEGMLWFIVKKLDSGRIQIPTEELVDLIEKAHYPFVKVVDLGCGGGRDSVFLAKKFNVTAVDI